MITPSDFNMFSMPYIYVLNLVKEIRRSIKDDKNLTKQALKNKCLLCKEKVYKKGKLFKGKPLLKTSSLGKSVTQVKK